MFALPNFTNAREIQRNYRRLFDLVKTTRKPLVVMRNNKPEVAIIDIKKFEEMEVVASLLRSLRQIKEGKAKLLTSLADL